MSNQGTPVKASFFSKAPFWLVLRFVRARPRSAVHMPRVQGAHIAGNNGGVRSQNPLLLMASFARQRIKLFGFTDKVCLSLKWLLNPWLNPWKTHFSDYPQSVLAHIKECKR